MVTVKILFFRNTNKRRLYIRILNVKPSFLSAKNYITLDNVFYLHPKSIAFYLLGFLIHLSTVFFAYTLISMQHTLERKEE